MSNEVIKVDIGKQFSRFPAGRTRDDGKWCGETFRDKYLKGPLADSKVVSLELDNALSYGSSFLEEAFGGLVRVYKYDPKFVKRYIKLVSTDPFLLEEIWQYVDRAADLEAAKS